MPIRRLRHPAVALFAIWVLLFAQLALAGYVCPDALVGAPSAGEACRDIDPAQPTLCHQHAAEQDQSQTHEVAKLHLPAVPIALVAQVRDLAASLAAPPGRAAHPAAAPRRRLGPLFLATRRLRI